MESNQSKSSKCDLKTAGGLKLMSSKGVTFSATPSGYFAEAHCLPTDPIKIIKKCCFSIQIKFITASVIILIETQGNLWNEWGREIWKSFAVEMNKFDLDSEWMAVNIALQGAQRFIKPRYIEWQPDYRSEASNDRKDKQFARESQWTYGSQFEEKILLRYSIHAI